MIERFANLFDAFNVIDRVTGIVAGLTNFERGTHRNRRKWRGLVQLRVPRQEGVSGQDIEDKLKAVGVPIHGRRVTSTELIFSVPQQQVGLARAVLAGRITRTWAEQKRGQGNHEQAKRRR